MPTRVCSGALVSERGPAAIDSSPAPNRPLCIVFMGLRIAEVHVRAIDQYFATKPPKRRTVYGDAS